MSESLAYESLHRAIVASELSPGERLVEEEIAGRLGTSRGAVRSALVRLTHDGLVVRQPNRGAQVRRITIAEAIEIVEARCALEPLAAGYAALRRSDPEGAELESLVAEMARLQAEGELLAASTLNGQLHRRILEISSHQVAIEVCGRLRSQVVRFQFRTVLAPGRATKSIGEHRAIVSAIADGDAVRARAAMSTHLSHVTAVLVAIAESEAAAAGRADELC